MSTQITSRPSLAGILAAETGFEFLKSLRMPQFSIPSLLFPPVFYAMFGIFLNPGTTSSGISVAQYMLATYGIFGAIGPSLFGFGVGIAAEREQGWLDIKRIAPIPVTLVFAAKLLMAMLFATLISIILFFIASVFGDVRMPTMSWLALLGLNIIASVPFGLMGLALGVRLKTQGAAALTNALYLSMSLLGGLWLPITLFPSILQDFAVVLPTYHMAGLALILSGLGSKFDWWVHMLALVLFSAAALWLAVRGWQRMDSDR